jgi:hypothetical protein
LKVKIINKDGIETAINPDTIIVGGITLLDLLKKLTVLDNKVLVLTKELAKKDKALQEAVKKL